MNLAAQGIGFSGVKTPMPFRQIAELVVLFDGYRIGPPQFSRDGSKSPCPPLRKGGTSIRVKWES